MKKIVWYLFCGLVIVPFAVHAAVDDQALYQGNTKSMIYHQKKCRYYGCKSCTVTFKTMEEAEKAGYSPCKICIVPFRDALNELEKKANNGGEIKLPPEITPDSPTISQALMNIAKNMCALLIAQLAVFGLYNCFLRGKFGLIERWKRFQCWLFGKSTENHLKKKMVQAGYEEAVLKESSGVKKGMLKAWYTTNHIFSWFSHFTGCFINFILFACFFLLSWNDGRLIVIKGWEWLKTVGG